MKKLTAILTLTTAVALTGCTLYMDDLEEGRVLRTGEGYLEQETTTLPDDRGTVTYQYSQNTIPINDETEQYIDRIESDTILYFHKDTPDELLPVVGEMMTCGFRERFPNGFCHRCTERTELADAYRLVFTGCEYDEAFNVLDAHFNQLELALPEGARYLTAVEDDSLFGASREEQSLSRSASPRRVGLNKHVKKMTIPIELQVGVSAIPDFDLAGADLAIGGELIIGGWVTGDISFTDQSADFDVGIIGGIGLVFDGQARAGATLKLPVGLTPLGFRFDLGVVGGQLGFVADPYLSLHHKAYFHAELGIGVDCGFHYKRDPNDKEHPYGEIEVTKSETSKMVGKSPFFYVNKGKEKAVGINLEAGVDYNIGVGFKILEGAADARVTAGLRQYGLIETHIDAGEYQSTADFKQANVDFPTYSVCYISLNAGVFWVGVKPEIVIGPGAEEVFKVPYFPVSNNEGNVWCRDMHTKTFSASAVMSERGILSDWWFDKNPMLNIYDPESKQLVTTLELKWDKDNQNRMYGYGKIPEIEYNREYIGQFALDMNAIAHNALFPIEDVPFHVARAEVSIDKTAMVKSQTADHVSLEELGNPKVIASNGTYRGFIYNNHVYNYRYLVDVDVTVKGATEATRWGLDIVSDNGIHRDVHVDDNSGKLTASYKVRIAIYSSKPEDRLDITSYCVGKVKDGYLSTTREEFDTSEMFISYTTARDTPFSITDSNYKADFEFYNASRRTDTSASGFAATTLPLGDGAVIGDVEILPLGE